MTRTIPEKSGPTLGADTSRQIVVCRVACIFFMMSVHVRPYFDASMWDRGDGMWWIGILWVDVLGRASVPTLSVISGFLIAMQFGRGTAGGFFWKRFRVLCLPMLAWNLVLQGFFLLPWLLLGEPSETRDLLFGGEGAGPLLEHLLFLYGHPSNVTLSFLRDLFVCSLVAYLALHLGSRGVLVALGFSVVLWLTDLYGELVLRNSILSFVLAGALVQRHLGHLRPPGAVAILAFSLLVLVTGLFWAGQAESLSEVVHAGLWSLAFRTVATLCMLDAAFRLARSRAFGLLKRWEPAAYLAYLSHSLVILVGWVLFERAVGDVTGATYVAFFVAMPPVCFVCAAAAVPLLDRLPRWLQVLARGKSRRRPPTRASQAPEVALSAGHRAPRHASVTS